MKLEMRTVQKIAAAAMTLAVMFGCASPLKPLAASAAQNTVSVSADIDEENSYISAQDQMYQKDFLKLINKARAKAILRGLRAMTSVDITPGDTLIILDEIQDIPEALESLKYFKEEVPEYHIAVAGSLLGISLHQDVSYPVGKCCGHCRSCPPRQRRQRCPQRTPPATRTWSG